MEVRTTGEKQQLKQTTYKVPEEDKKAKTVGEKSSTSFCLRST